MSLESRLSALIAAIGADIKALQSAGGGGGGGLSYVLPSNVVYSGAATTATDIAANVDSADVWTISVPAGQRLKMESLVMFTTAAATTGAAVGCNMTTAATGAVNAILDVEITAPLTHAQATSAAHVIARSTSTTNNNTVGQATLNTAQTNPQVNGARVVASCVNRGAQPVTFRLKIGSEVVSSAVTVQANTAIDYQLITL